MRRSFFHDRFLKNFARIPGDEVARRRRILFSAFLLVMACLFCSMSPAAELANPMEKLFSDADEEPRIPSGRGGKFSDQVLPHQVKNSSPAASVPAKKKRSDIRQVSGQASETTAANADVWNSIAASSDNETTRADWGVTPSTSYPTYASRTPSAPNGSFPQGALYSNTGDAMPASPAPANPGTVPFGYGDAANPPGMGYGYHGAAPGGNQPFFTDPYAASGMADPYAAYGNMYGMSGAGGMPGYYNSYNPYDPYGTAMQAPFQQQAGQQQLALYQAMLQQEMIRHEVEQEAEEEERAAREAEDAPQSVNPLMPIHVTSPLGKTLVSCAKTLSPFSTPTGPDRGVGQPLRGVSWLDRPWYFGGFCGWISGSELVKNMIDQEDGGMGGLILGYNLSEYWGVESRVHFASIDIRETANGRQVFNDWYKEYYPDSTYTPTLTTRTNQLSVFDVSVHYYPLGNAKWRPFFKYGLGLGRENFVDTYGVKRRENTMTMPLGIGLRYWWNKNLAIQVDLVDNVVFSSGSARTQNNFAFCVGLTYSFGSSKKKRPTILWPYVPSHGSKR